MSKLVLNALKTLDQVAKVSDLLIANVQSESREDCLTAYTVVLRKRVKKALEEEYNIRSFISELPSGSFDDLDTLVSIAKTFLDYTQGLGSIPKLQYSLNVTSTGITCNKFGASNGLTLKLNDKVIVKQSPYNFLTLSLKGSDLTIERYNAIKNRIVILQGTEVEIPDYFMLEALLSNSNICIDTLLNDVDTVLVLNLVLDTIDLSPVPHPLTSTGVACVLTDIFGISYYTAPSKAEEGYVSYKSIESFKGLITKSGDNVKSFLGAKKFVARQEKLNSDTCIARVREEVFFATSSPKSLNKLFNTGCFYASNKLLKKIGCSRLTSDFQNGLIKGATHIASLIHDGSVSIVASSSSKGDIYSLSNALGISVNDISDVTPEMIIIKGEEVYGVRAKVVLKITNAYTVENFKRKTKHDTASSLEEAYAEDVAKRVSNVMQYDAEEVSTIAKRAFNKGDVIQSLSDMEQEGSIVLQPALTDVTPYEFENVSLSYGRDVAESFLDSLLKTKFNCIEDEALVSTYEYITSKMDIVDTITVNNLLNVVEELANTHNVTISENPSSYINAEFFKDFVKTLQLNTQGWVLIEELNVQLPVGQTLYGDLFNKENEFATEFMMNNIAKYLFSTIGYLLAVKFNNVLKKDVAEFYSVVGTKLNMFIQYALINKKTCKLKSHGKYMVLLPGFWLENVSDVCILSRDLYKPESSDQVSIRVNIAKHPTIFMEAVAGFNCFKDIPGMELTDEIISMFMSVVFVHPNYLLQLQNDCDGDLARVTFDGYCLPLYEGKVMQGCMNSFHQDYIEGENKLGINLDKQVSYLEYDHIAIAHAVKEAAEAKKNVAMFTDNVHRLQGSFRTSSLTKYLLSKYGKQVGLQMVKDMVVLVATLVQTDAMNSIKHNGQASLGSLLTSVEIKNQEFSVLIDAVKEYLVQHNVDVHADFAENLVCMMLSVHDVDSKGENFIHLNNQIERLVFKNAPKVLFKYVNFNGQMSVGSTPLVLKGMFKSSLNVTGDNSMFCSLLSKFFDRFEG